MYIDIAHARQRLSSTDLCAVGDSSERKGTAAGWRQMRSAVPNDVSGIQAPSAVTSSRTSPPCRDVDVHHSVAQLVSAEWYYFLIYSRMWLVMCSVASVCLRVSVSKWVSAFLWRQHIRSHRAPCSWFPKKVSPRLSSEQSVGNVWIAQLDRKRVPHARSRGGVCVSVLFVL